MLLRCEEHSCHSIPNQTSMLKKEHCRRYCTCVMVPIKTENRLRFSVRLDDGVPEVHLEWVSVS
jgi:hypothetical protein